ncbi:endo alpha-1,4 polygalactosaminidase [Devosia sp.]|uniref:endo alpha-1,4 polygalactosaminidase n=1 Tax=Devosia sp. TaxID=1871048 RepID=UPI0032652355
MRLGWAAALLLLVGPALATDIALPPAGGQYDPQLAGAYAPSAGTTIVSRDRSNPPFKGGYSICYVNAFQTQPQEAAWWKANHPDLLLKQRSGNWLEDTNWPGEILLDTSTATKRAALTAIVGAWIDQCAQDGFSAIEADNLDTYSRSDGALTIAENLAFAESLIDRAHALGLAFGQKNGAELGQRGRDIGFDFAIVESCQTYDECDAYTGPYGRHVLEIEYTDTPAPDFITACAIRGRQISVIRRDRGLSMPGNAAYFYEHC